MKWKFIICCLIIANGFVNAQIRVKFDFFDNQVYKDEKEGSNKFSIINLTEVNRAELATFELNTLNPQSKSFEKIQFENKNTDFVLHPNINFGRLFDRTLKSQYYNP